MIRIIITSVLLFSTISMAQKELAIIKRPNEYVDVRENREFQSKIIGKIHKNEIFYFEPKESEKWIKIRKESLLEHMDGFVPKSSILPIKSLPDSNKRRLLIDILDEELRLYNKFYNQQISNIEYDNYHVSNIWPIFGTSFFSDFVCMEKDTTLILLLLELINLERGSADQLPSFALGKVYICEPNLTLEMIDIRYTDWLLNELESGFENATYQKEQEVSNYNILKFKLDSLIATRKKN